MENENFRYDRNKTIISGLLDKVFQEEQVVTFWQNVADKRIVYKAHIRELNSEKKVIILKLTNEELALDLVKDEPVYFHADERNLIFKSHDFIREDNLVTMPIPEEVKLTEKRSSTRFNLKKHLIRTVEHLKRIEGKGLGKLKNLSVNCLDISQTGIALEINVSQLSSYLIGDKIVIKEVAGIAINNMEAEIIHICPVDERKKLYRAGLVFTKILSTEVIKDILFTGNVAV